MLHAGMFILLYPAKSVLFDGDLRRMRILYLTEADVKHLQTCKHNITVSPPLFPRRYKHLILMSQTYFLV